MNQVAKLIVFFLLVSQYACRVIPAVRYTTANAHSHNDYLAAEPFFLAYRSGFGSVEADVFPVKDMLYVAHKKEEITPENTLRTLYIQPLLAALQSGGSGEFRLLVDIKENYRLALPMLIRELAPLQPWLTGTGKPNRVKVLITGLRPPPAGYSEYPSYIFFDDDLKLKHSPEEWDRVGLVSLPFNKITAWKGVGLIPRKDRQLLKHTIDSVHAAGKPIRFWAAPDTDLAWKIQQQLRVDLIGTDKIADLGNLLRKGSK